MPLTTKGEQEARSAGETLRKAGIKFDIAFSSLLIRATETNRLALESMGQPEIETKYDWRLNERHYGTLQGLDKKATTARYGAEQTNIWRRSYDIAPPPVDVSSPEHPAKDPRYTNIPAAELPATECLKDVVARIAKYFDENIAPELRQGRNVLVTSHGNSLRALVMHLENLSATQIAEFNIPTGTPRLYEFASDLRVIKVGYLGDQIAIAQATKAVADQASGSSH